MSRTKAIEMHQCGMPRAKFDGAVDRIDHPDVAPELAAALLAEERVVRERREHALADHALDLRVGFEHVVLRPLEGARRVAGVLA